VGILVHLKTSSTRIYGTKHSPAYGRQHEEVKHDNTFYYTETTLASRLNIPPPQRSITKTHLATLIDISHYYALSF
jgi:hypothetical protein